MEEDESFDEFYAKLKDIINSVFNLGETITEPKVVRKVIRSLPERFHAKITVIEESNDIDSIPWTKLVSNLQTYELGLTRIGKGSKSKSMALKAKSNETDESSDDEDSKIKSYITRQFKKFMKNANVKGFDKDNPILLISKAKIEERRMIRMVISTLFPPNQTKVLRMSRFGHMKQECPTYLKSVGKNKALAATLSDIELEI